MTETFHGIVEVKDTGCTIRLDGNTGDIAVLRKIGGRIREILKFDGSTGTLVLRRRFGEETFRLDSSRSTVSVGSTEVPGELIIGNYGKIVIHDHRGRDILTIGGTHTAVTIGGKGRHSRITLLSSEGNPRIRLDGGRSNIWVGGNDQDGGIGLFSRRVTETDNADLASVHLDGETGIISLSVRERGNRVTLRPDEFGALHLGGDDGYGGIVLDPAAKLKVGGNGRGGRIWLFDRDATELRQDTAAIRVTASTGDIVFQNADCAEEFDIAEPDQPDPGTVMVIEEEDKLRRSMQAYDTRVAGVISGAADTRPGIILGRKESGRGRIPLALAGKVFCKADAKYASIHVGDLLTTSETPGHAMKATDPLRSFGAVLGKALRPLPEGAGLIPILVALQ